MIPESFKQDLLNRVDIVEVVSRYVQLKKGGANYLGLCPFHNEKTPSFTVSPAKQFYHCFGCGAHGNAIGFMMSYGGLGYVDSIKELASSVGMQVPEWQPRTPQEAERRERQTDLVSVLEAAMAFYRAELKKSPRAIEYLKGRGLSGEIAARFRIGYAPEDWQSLRAPFPDYEHQSLVEAGLVVENEGKRYDRFRDRIMFPIFNARGAVVGFGGRLIGESDKSDSAAQAGPKYLNSPETPVFEKGREVYGLVQARDAIRAAGRALVVEGYMDVVALAQFGVGYSVATLGTATTPVHVAKLLRLADELVFSFDGDAAGRKAAWRALEVSLPLATDAKPIRFLFLPEDDDPDSYIRNRGREAFERLVREAPTLSGFLLSELRAGADLSSAEGRSKYLVAAKPHLHKLTAPALRLQLLKEIADAARVSQEEARQLLEVKDAPAFARPAPARAQQRAPVSHEWNLLACVAAYPRLAAELDLASIDARTPEGRALTEIAHWCRSVPDIGRSADAMLIERFQDQPGGELVFSAQAYSIQLKLTEAEAREQLRQRMWKLDIESKNRVIEELRKRLEQGALTKDEHVRYGRMIAEVKQLEQKLMADGRGPT
ncbi:MAG: DNA primase [Betaproteobacteria bacterium]|nr:DNA primase [Betaproteobacteria bacterium]